MGPVSGRATRERWNASRPGSPPTDTACIAPAVALEFDPEGLVYACCASQLYPLGRIGEQRLAELWNGPRSKVLKEALVDWDFSVACQACRFAIDHGDGEPVAAVYDRYEADSMAPEFPKVMSFALSNRCNLGCVMCTPALSSRLRSEAGLAPLASPYDDQFFDDLAPFLHRLEVAKFLGGEPFLVREHRRVWELMDEVGSDAKLEITTNGTVWSPLVDWLMQRFRVDVSVSVDAFEPETYSAIRRGGDLAQVRRNLDSFSERCREAGTNLHLSFCLMCENWDELAPFLQWAEAYTFGPPVTVNNVATGGHALFDLPTDALQEIREVWARQDAQYGPALSRNRVVWEDQLVVLDSVIAERRRGTKTMAPRAQPVKEAFSSGASAGSETISLQARSPLADRTEVQMSRLRHWCGGGPVAELHADSAGRVLEVASEHAPLGVFTESMVGHSLDELTEVIARTDGRRVWLIDADVRPEATVRSFVVAATEPIRGVAGRIVRTIEMRHGGGSIVLLAEDTIYDRGREAGVQAL